MEKQLCKLNCLDGKVSHILKNKGVLIFCEQKQYLSVGFSDTLEFVLLFDRVRVGRSFRSVDELIRQTLSYRFDVSKCSLSCSSAQKPNCLIYATQGGNIHSLTANGSRSTDSRRIFPRSRIDYRSDQNLQTNDNILTMATLLARV